MVLEATMICIDNSEWMRNGDYSPSRFQAQADAVNLVCGIKTGANPENTVGVLTMAGKGVRVLATPTSDLGQILTCTHGLEIGGEINIAAAVQVAQLALKHRQNKNQQQRIVVFAGSPVKHGKKALEIIAKKLKKNSVALDIVNFGGEDDEKLEKLEALVAAVDNRNTSHVVHIPSGHALSEALLSTPILTEQGEDGVAAEAAAAAAGIGGSSGFEFGVDPNIDPELALALRISMEEERARQEAAEARRAEEEATKQGKEEERPSKSEDVAMTEGRDVEMVDENALLMQALAMSMGDAEMSEATGVDQDLALALQMSTKESAGGASSSEAADVTKVMDYQSFLSFILESLPGVDPNDPSVKEFLASLTNQSDKNEQDPSNDQDK